MKTRLLCATAFLAVSGCASNQYNVRAIEQAQATQRHVSEKNYHVGKEQTVYVGQAIARVKDYYVQGESTPSFTSPVAISTSWWMGKDRLYPEGTQLRAVALMDYQGKTYSIAMMIPALYQEVGLLVDANGHYSGMAIARNGIVFHPCDLGAVCVKPASIDFTKSTHETVVSTSHFTNFEIVYSGATKDSLNLLYREYTPQDMARPAFTQNLTYASDSKSIRFRDMQIDVRKADNQGITYTVVQDGMPSN